MSKPGSKKSSRKSRRKDDALVSELKNLTKEEIKKKKATQEEEKLKEKLALEEQLTRKNGFVIQEAWRELMRKAKSEELKKEIAVIQELHERTFNNKNKTISKLEAEMEELEQEYDVALQSHLKNLQSLIEIHQQRLATLEAEFDKDLNELVAEYDQERKEMVQRHHSDKEELLDVIGAMEEEYNEAENDGRQEFQNQRDYIKNQNSSDFASLKLKMDYIISKLEDEFRSANSTYSSTTEQQNSKLKFMRQQDEQNMKTIETNNRKLHRLQKNLNHWRTKMTNNIRECEHRNKALKEEKEAIAAHFQQLKGKMTKFRERQNSRLVELTSNCNLAIRELSSKLSIAERILSLVEMNSKLETDHEKLFPLLHGYVANEDAENQAAELINPQTTPRDPLSTKMMKDGKLVESWQYLENFFAKSNKVLLDKAALESEKGKLLKEQQELKAGLQRFLNDLSVNHEVMGKDNSLLILNGNSGRITSPIATAREAATIKNVVKQQLLVFQHT